MLPVANNEEQGEAQLVPESSLKDETPTEQVPSSEPKEEPASLKSSKPSQDKPRLDLTSPFIARQNGASTARSASSEFQLNSPGSFNDRVFPVRSVVSVDSSQTPYVFPGRHSGDHNDYFPPDIVPPGVAGQDMAPPSRTHPSVSGSDGKHTPRIHKQETKSSNQRSTDERKRSSAVTYNQLMGYGGKGIYLDSDASSETMSTGGDSGSLKGILKPRSVASITSSNQESISGLVTARFKHIITAEGHAVITGRDGETLQRCEDEPIHLPGAVRLIVQPCFHLLAFTFFSQV